MITKTAVVAQESPTKKQTGRKTAVFLLPIFSILFTILLVEGGLRLAIAADIPYFRNPALYTYPFTDDYWKLLYRWDGRATDGTSENVNPDPFLGWTPRTTSENPLGLMGQKSYVPDLDGNVVLFYGDSFVAGKTENAADNVPNQLAQQITADAVYNFGVSNYGVDQIYLRFRETHTAFSQPTIVIGIFTLDMDRSLISVRSSAPKPYFSVENNDLILHGIDHVQIDSNAADWIASWHEAHPPKIKSYAWAFLTRRLDSLRTGNDWMRSTVPQSKLEQLNGLLMSEMAAEAQANDIPIQFVVFYTRGELDETYWRESFILSHLDSLGVPYLDTKQLLLETAVSEQRDLWDYYFADGGHTNELGNAVIAGALAKQFQEQSN